MTKEEKEKLLNYLSNNHPENYLFVIGLIAVNKQGVPKTLDDLQITVDEYLDMIKKCNDKPTDHTS